jgi:mono/diheme cytochrome c family protein
MRWLPLALLLSACSVCELGLDADGDGVCDGDGVDWSVEASVPEGTDRGNIYGLPDAELEAVRRAGLLHATQWPVATSGVFVPHRALRVLFDEDSDDPTVQSARTIARNTLGFHSFDELVAWVGAPVMGPGGEGPYDVPRPEGFGEGDRFGVSVVDTELGEGLTFSCGACHAGRLLGRTVVGLPNRRPRANVFFDFGKDVVDMVDPDFLVTLTDASEGEVEMLRQAALRLPSVGHKVPEVLGLDTSLAQVALSLARRTDDPWATRDWVHEANPEPNALEEHVADSKPMPWWTMKHKTRWLADGSVVSGNPIHTNLLWNELGRGTDLDELQAWMEDNQAIVDELTVAVFASEPPRWTDAFDASTVDVAAAQRGQAHFEALCARCHGFYDKDWSAPFETAVRYPERTPVIDVGTDPGRWQGMQHFADRLNGLAISEAIATVVEPQQGYVPPPLTGIWARYPYLHNNAVPTLCDLLKPADQRPTAFVQGPSESMADFDADCVGYPVGDAMPAGWAEDDEAAFDTTRPGLSNAGHDAWLVDEQGDEVLSDDDRADLVAYLKTM